MRPDDEFSADDLKELHREAVELAEQLAGLRGAGSGSFVGRDAQGAVEVTMDGEGRVRRVRLDPKWRDVVGLYGLGPAVVTAVGEVSVARLTSMQAPDQPGEPRLTEVDGGAGGVVGSALAEDWRAAEQAGQPGDPSSSESVRNIRDVMTLLEAFEGQLAQLNEALEQQQTGEIIGNSSSRTVMARIVNGAVTAVEFDQQWLSASHHDRIAAGVQDTLRDAQQTATSAAQEAIKSFPAVGEVQTLGYQPEVLLRRLGFLR